jgi:hypothetical protein
VLAYWKKPCLTKIHINSNDTELVQLLKHCVNVGLYQTMDNVVREITQSQTFGESMNVTVLSLWPANFYITLKYLYRDEHTLIYCSISSCSEYYVTCPLNAYDQNVIIDMKANNQERDGWSVSHARCPPPPKEPSVSFRVNDEGCSYQDSNPDH